jgi:PGF-pre-PGF domain-containing protein
MGIPPQSPVITTSSNGGGGGGVKSGENVSNIEVIEKYDMQISKDVLTSYRFTHAKSPIMFVNITGNTSPGVITTAVEVLKDTSTLVKVPPEGLVYKNANIWVGTTGFATPKNIKEALIKFRVNNDWMSTNGFSASDIVLNRWDGSQWIALETREMDASQEFTFFEAKTNSFSPFAIVGKILEIPGSLSGTAPTKASGLTQQAAMIPTEVGTEPTAIQAGVFLMMAVGIILIVIIAIRVNKFRNLKEKK